MSSLFEKIKNEFVNPHSHLRHKIPKDIASAAADWTGKFVNSKLSPPSQRWLDANASGIITNVEIKRAPVHKAITSFLDAAAGGRLNKKTKELGYDSLFHLSVVVTYTIGGATKYVQIEKLERVSLSSTIQEAPNTERFIVRNIPSNVQIGTVIKKMMDTMGDNFYKYDAFVNNCQNFIVEFMKALGRYDVQGVKEFVFQNAKEILTAQPGYLGNLAKSITNLGAIVHQVIHGGVRGGARIEAAGMGEWFVFPIGTNMPIIYDNEAAAREHYNALMAEEAAAIAALAARPPRTPPRKRREPDDERRQPPPINRRVRAPVARRGRWNPVDTESEEEAVEIPSPPPSPRGRRPPPPPPPPPPGIAGRGKNVIIPKKDFINEHEHLISLLKTSKSKKLINEGNKQAAELKNMQRGGIRPPICRIGSKTTFVKLLDYVAPPHKIYVEAFMGSGAFYWHKKPAEVDVVNDLDKDVVHVLHLIKKVSGDVKDFPNIDTPAKGNELFARKATSPEEEFIRQNIKHCSGYYGQPLKEGKKIFKANFKPNSKVKNIGAYKDRMKGTVISSSDYADVIKEWDSSETFFLFDPPYEHSTKAFGYAEHESFNFERFAEKVKNIKGKFIVTINDSPRIRDLFKGFHIYEVTVKGVPKHSKTGAEGIGTKNRNEILISNYEFPKDWKQHLGSARLMTGGGLMSDVFGTVKSYVKSAPGKVKDAIMGQLDKDSFTRKKLVPLAVDISTIAQPFLDAYAPGSGTAVKAIAKGINCANSVSAALGYGKKRKGRGCTGSKCRGEPAAVAPEENPMSPENKAEMAQEFAEAAARDGYLSSRVLARIKRERFLEGRELTLAFSRFVAQWMRDNEVLGDIDYHEMMRQRRAEAEARAAREEEERRRPPPPRAAVPPPQAAAPPVGARPLTARNPRTLLNMDIEYAPDRMAIVRYFGIPQHRTKVKKFLFKFHPDKGGNTEDFQDATNIIEGAYELAIINGEIPQ